MMTVKILSARATEGYGKSERRGFLIGIALIAAASQSSLAASWVPEGHNSPVVPFLFYYDFQSLSSYYDMQDIWKAAAINWVGRIMLRFL